MKRFGLHLRRKVRSQLADLSALAFFVAFSATLNWRTFFSPISMAPTTQFINGIGANNLATVPAVMFSGYSSWPGLGASAAFALPSLTFALPLYLFFVLTGNVNLAYRIWLLIMYLIMFYGTFYFLKKMLRIHIIPAVLGTLIMILAPLNLNGLAQGSPASFITIPGYAAALYYAMKFFEDRKAVTFLGFLVATFVVGSYPPTLLLELISVLVYTPFALFRGNTFHKIGNLTLNAFLLMIGAFLSVMYYSLPAMIAILENPNQVGFASALQSSNAVSVLVSQRGSYFPPNNFIGFDYGFVLYRNVIGYVSVTFKTLLIQEAYIVMPLVVAVAFLSLLIVGHSGRKFALYFAVLYAVGVSLYSGANFPALLLLLMQLLPLPFVVLRSSGNVAPMIYLALGSMVALSTNVFFRHNGGIRMAKSSAKRDRICTIALVGTILLLLSTTVFPLAETGDFLGTSPPVEMPTYYQQAYEFMVHESSTNFFRVAIPGLTGIYRVYWAPNNFWETSPFLLLGVPFIYEWYIQPMPMVARAAFSLLDSQPTTANSSQQQSLLTLLGLMSVKYVVAQCDIVNFCENPAFDNHSMRLKLGPVPSATFGNITLYSNPRFLPLIYIPSTLILVSNDTNSWISAAGSPPVSATSALALTSDSSIFNKVLAYAGTLVGDGVASLHEAEVINYTSNVAGSNFRIIVNSSKGPFLLVLSNTYDPRFAASVDGGLVIDHFQINSFSNAWIISPMRGQVVVRINYELGTLGTTSLSLWVATVGLLTVYLIAHNLRKLGPRTDRR